MTLDRGNGWYTLLSMMQYNIIGKYWVKWEGKVAAACPVSGIDSSQLIGGMRLFLFLIPHGFFLHTPAGSKSKLAVL